MRAFVLEGDQVVMRNQPEKVRDAVAHGLTVWLDLDEATQTTDAAGLLENTFRLHPLAIEDIWSEEAAPKIEQFPGYLYVLANEIRCGKSLELEVRDVDVVIGKNFVITHHRTQLRAIDEVMDDLHRSPHLLMKGPPWLAHAVLDHIVDGYLPLMDSLDEEIEGLDNEVIEKAGLPEGRPLLGQIFRLKRALQGIRRSAAHQREMLLRLSRGEFEAIPADAIPFYRDVSDHFVRVTDLSEGYRDLVTSALDAYLSVQGNRMNEVMKTLTLISTTMLPLTFIAGLYGMNFKVMPELDWRYGYPFALVLMVLVSGSILVWFRKRGWL